MTRSTENPWLARYALFTAFSTLVLICVGGLVTSHGVGMAVPDWPNTFGYNLFFFPISQWVGGIFYEHTHRLVASYVGLLTTILAIWLWLKESRKWLRWMGVLALAAVVLQGVLGGLRVVLIKDELGIFHGTIAHLFLTLLALIALFTHARWQRFWKTRKILRDTANLRFAFLTITIMIFTQLILGATMRHQHAGLAVPDFPLAHGRIWPATDPDSIAQYNRSRMEVRALNPITAFQVHLHMGHRVLALGILVGITAAMWRSSRSLGPRHPVTRICMIWFGLILGQLFLGVATVWTGKSADIATAHVAVGALSLMTGTLATVFAFQALGSGNGRTLSRFPSHDGTDAWFRPGPAAAR